VACINVHVSFAREEDQEWTEGGARRSQPKKRSAPGSNKKEGLLKVGAAKSPKPMPSISDNAVPVEAQEEVAIAQEVSTEAPFEPKSPTTPRKPPPGRPQLLLWRKYGQKKLKGLGIVRCYYKCHLTTCPAKKFIDKAASDLNHTLGVRFDSMHNHTLRV